MQIDDVVPVASPNRRFVAQEEERRPAEVRKEEAAFLVFFYRLQPGVVLFCCGPDRVPVTGYGRRGRGFESRSGRSRAPVAQLAERLHAGLNTTTAAERTLVAQRRSAAFRRRRPLVGLQPGVLGKPSAVHDRKEGPPCRTCRRSLRALPPRGWTSRRPAEPGRPSTGTRRSASTWRTPRDRPRQRRTSKPRIRLRVADCENEIPIALWFEADDAGLRHNSLHKIATLIAALFGLGTGFE